MPRFLTGTDTITTETVSNVVVEEEGSAQSQCEAEKQGGRGVVIPIAAATETKVGMETETKLAQARKPTVQLWLPLCPRFTRICPLPALRRVHIRAETPSDPAPVIVLLHHLANPE